MTRTNKSHHRNGKGPTLRQILLALVEGQKNATGTRDNAVREIASKANVVVELIDDILDRGIVLNSNDANRKRLMKFATSPRGVGLLLATSEGRAIDLAIKEKGKALGKNAPAGAAVVHPAAPSASRPATRPPFTPVPTPAATQATQAAPTGTATSTATNTMAPKFLTYENMTGAQPTKITRVYFALDKSSSMHGLTKKVEANYNMLLRSLAAQAEKYEQSITVTLATFNGDVDLIYTDRPAHLAPMLHEGALRAGGSTSLYTALAKGCSAIDRPIGKAEDVAHLVLVITDGEDTTGVDGGRILRTAVDTYLTRRNDYTIAVYSPNRETAIQVMTRTGISREQADNIIVDWTTTEKGVEDLRQSVETSMTSYLDARASGMKSVRSFAQRVNADASKLDFASFDRAKYVKSFEVITNGRIDDTLEMRLRKDAEDLARREGRSAPNGPFFENGTGYYELKDDVTVVVQPQKRIILARDVNGKPEYYTGAKVRRALGLSDTADSKLRAGDLRGVKVYVQSTAPNRQLLAGTRVLHYKHP